MTNPYTMKPGKYSNKKNISTEDEFFGDSWSVLKTGDKYYFEYISGELQGKLKKVEISKESFDEVRVGNFSFEEVYSLLIRK